MKAALIWRLAIGLGGKPGMRQGLADSWQTLLALGLGAALLVASLAVFRGFEHELLTRILNFGFHVAVTDRYGAPIKDWNERATRLNGEIPGARAVIPFARVDGMLSHGPRRAMIRIQSFALDAEARTRALGLELDEAQRAVLDKGELLLGAGLAKELEITSQLIDDDGGIRVRLLSRPEEGGPLRLKKLTVGGVFATGTDLDRFMALMNFKAASTLAGHPGAASGLGVLLEDPLQAPALALKMERDSQGSWQARDWSDWFGDLYEAVQLSRRLLLALLMAAILIATFNLGVGLIIGINRCRGELAMLRTMGASCLALKTVMLLRGALLSLGGALIGVIIGAPGVAAVAEIIAAAQRRSDWRLLPEGMYFLDYIPIRLEVADISTVALVSFLLCLPATWIAARHIDRLRPAEVLRWE